LIADVSDKKSFTGLGKSAAGESQNHRSDRH
jgi:hypothetical protein